MGQYARKGYNMARLNCNRNGCKDVFHSYLVRNAILEGELGIPYIHPESQVPHKLISFTDAIRGGDPDAWVHFYQDDVKFERFWNYPQRYLPILQRYAGIITPDYSLYRDMPLAQQQWNIYRGRALGYWVQENGCRAIVNVRVADERTYESACTGVPRHAAIAIGSHGCLRCAEDRSYFARGLHYIVDTLEPDCVIVYGIAPDDIFGPYRSAGIRILQFDSDYKIAHRKEVKD